jgi:hypothetical protein
MPLFKGTAYARRLLVAKLWVSYAETHPETLIDNESNHLKLLPPFHRVQGRLLPATPG